MLVDELEAAGNLFDHGRMTHSYPHCWRCESPLIYMARDSWFAATSTLKERMLENNDRVAWHPPEVGEKRFGAWLEGNVDWALSRDRYWGTPLPVWVCDADDGHHEWIGSFAALEERAGPLDDDFDPHRPFIDEVQWPCADCGGTMRRTPGVIDVWFDSGAMPYAQWHYPFENADAFEAHFPADFICEGLDQTRGWFYSLMAISTMLDRGPAYRNVVVNDLILDAEGQKMSKSRGNAVNPWEAVEGHGADAVRWYLITSSNPWLPKRYDPEGVAEASRKFFDTLFNSYRFFRMYAETEGWAPSEADPAPEHRTVLDRWLLGRLSAVTEEVGRELGRYEVTRAYRALGDFLTEDLSNWYVRRSRARFWGNTDEADARAAFRTLRDALRTVALLAAPVTPFSADWLHRALTGGESAHLASFPVADAGVRDAGLEADMAAARELVSLGRAAREEAGIRVRQPLRTLFAVVPGGREPADAVLDVVKDELNVKEVRFLASAEELVALVAKPDFRSLGPRFQQHSEAAASAIRALSDATLRRFRDGDEVTIEVDGREHALRPEDLDIEEEARGDLVVRSENGTTAALDPSLDGELVEEGLARETVNRVQRLRRDAGLEITDRIELGVFAGDEVRAAAELHRDFIAGEVLAVEVVLGDRDEAGDADFDHSRDVDLDGREATLALRLARSGEPAA